MKKKMLTAAAVISAATLALASCAQAPGTGTQTPGATTGGDTGKFKACMVSDSGGFDDKSFNQTSHDGLVKAEKELGIATQKIESASNADFAKNLQAMIDAKCNVVVTVGFLLADATKAAAAANPNINFVIVDSPSEGTLKNHKGLQFNTAESSFMAGYLAAGMSQSGKVGTFGGAKIPPVTIFMDGFSQGVAYYNQQKGKSVQVLGWDAAKQNGMFVPGQNPFDNTSGGKETANSLIANGADILLPVAGPSGIGALQAAQEQGGKVNAIWVDTDGCKSAEPFCGQLLSSVYKGMDVAVFEAIKEAKDGKFTNTSYVGTLKNGGTGLSPFHEFESKVPAELKSELDQLKTEIESGKIKIESQSQPKA